MFVDESFGVLKEACAVHRGSRELITLLTLYRKALRNLDVESKLVASFPGEL
jgi:hypothetical protein